MANASPFAVVIGILNARIIIVALLIGCPKKSVIPLEDGPLKSGTAHSRATFTKVGARMIIPVDLCRGVRDVSATRLDAADRSFSSTEGIGPVSFFGWFETHGADMPIIRPLNVLIGSSYLRSVQRMVIFSSTLTSMLPS